MAASDTLIGLPAWTAAPAQIAAAIETRTRDVALAAAMRVADGIRARVHVHLQGRLRMAVRVAEDGGAKQFAVGLDDMSLIQSGLPAMIAIWHEFGTVKMLANPAVGDAYAEERPRYLREMQAAIDAVGEEFSK